MLFFDIVRDGFVHFVSTNTNRVTVNYSSKRYNRDFGSSAAYINYHGTCWFCYRKTCSDCGCHWLFYRKNSASTGTVCGFLDGFFFNCCSTSWNANYNLRTCKISAIMHFPNEVFNHSFSDFKISNYSVFHRTNCRDISGSSSDH